MGTRTLGALVALTLALSAGGCGTARSTGSSSASSAAPSVATGTTSSGTTGTAGTTSVTGTSTSTTAATHTGHRRSGGAGHGGAPITAATPGGLTPTAGYGTYEQCAGTCTGSVPASLRRPLALPGADGGPCPVTLATGGPIDESGSTQIGFANVPGSSWMSAALTWTAKGYYQGPVLVRGREIGGSGVIGFGPGQTPYDELQLLDAGTGAPRVANGGRAWLTQARITGPGCYAFQVDGTGFSQVFVFRAVG